MTTEPYYSDDPFDDEIQHGKKKPKKLYGKTALQTAALKATGHELDGFRDNKQWKAFQELEANAIGADNDSRVWYAWIMHRINETTALNKKIKCVNLDQLIHRIGMEDKRVYWDTDNRARVLAKKSPEELVASTEGVELAMQRRKNAKS